MLLDAQKQAVALKSKLFRGFSDPSRLSILESLHKGPKTVSEIVAATSLSQSNVSNHLGCLRDCGLVLATQQGRFTSYQLSDERVARLLELSDELLAEVARGLYECVNYSSEEAGN
jgi:DNA-binding transcriptional ArsR family regulator